MRRVVFAPSGCWEWTGFVNRGGYGQLQIRKQPWGAHRVAFVLFVRDLVEGEVIDHECRNRRCVNPWHLRACSQAENIGWGAGRYINRAEVTFLLDRGYSRDQVAALLGVTPNSVTRAASGRPRRQASRRRQYAAALSLDDLPGRGFGRCRRGTEEVVP